MLGGRAKPHFGSGSRPEGPKPEAQRAESRSGVLGDGAASSVPTSGSAWGSAVSSPSEVRGARPVKDFLHSEAPDGLSWNLLGVQLWGHIPL